MSATPRVMAEWQARREKQLEADEAREDEGRPDCRELTDRRSSVTQRPRTASVRLRA